MWKLARIERSPLAIMAVLTTLAAAPAAAHAACDLSDSGSATIVEILNTESLLLEDGRAIRLVGALGPRVQTRWAEAMGLKETLTSALKALVLGKRVQLRRGARERDRYGRLLSHVFIGSGDERIWVQEALIRDGLAMAYSFAQNRDCMRPLLHAEAQARAAQAGLWKSGVFRVRDAADPESMKSLSYSFQIVEGLVAATAEKRGRVYINFGADWRSDFTVAVAASARKAFDGSGIDLLALTGQRVRVRGWLKPRNGPLIEASHPEQIEVLGDDGDAAALPGQDADSGLAGLEHDPY